MAEVANWFVLLPVGILPLVFPIVVTQSCPSMCQSCTSIDPANWYQGIYKCGSSEPPGCSPSRMKLSTARDSISDEINDFLQQMPQLTYIIINITEMTIFPAEICNKNALTQLYVDNNQFDSFPDGCFIKMLQLQVLEADNNCITHLQDGLFAGLQNLANLSLKNNLIQSIDPLLFARPTELQLLGKLDLSHNQLTTLDLWPYVRAQAYSVQYQTGCFFLDVSYNQISNFSNFVPWKLNCNVPVKVQILLSRNKIAHFVDIFDAFRIQGVSGIICLIESKIFNLVFDDNPINCDCKDYTLTQYINTYPVSMFRNVMCSKPDNLSGKQLSNVPLHGLICPVVNECPLGCTCTNHPAQSTLRVDSCRGLNSLPNLLPYVNSPRSTFIVPHAKYHLDFSNNNITNLDIESRRWYFTNTSYLSLSNSNLQNIDVAVLKQLLNIAIVRLDGNQLTALQSEIARIPGSFKTISLHNNPWLCNCENLVWFQKWLLSLAEAGRLNTSEDIKCHSPFRLHGSNILNISSSFCTLNLNNDKLLLWIIILVSSMSMLVFILLVSAYKLRMRVFKKLGLHPFDRDECEGESMTYDAFLMCDDDSEDRRYGIEVVEFLRTENYKICFSVEFLLGASELLNLKQALVKSKRVLCIVSENFVSSNLCVHKFEAVLYHNQELKCSRLVVILLRQFEFPESAVIVEDFVKTHTRIDWDNEERWKDQILYAMPVNKLGCDERVGITPNLNDSQDTPRS